MNPEDNIKGDEIFSYYPTINNNWNDDNQKPYEDIIDFLDLCFNIKEQNNHGNKNNLNL